MRLVVLVCLTMVAFALNSVLNRAAVDGGFADASAFAIVRVLAGVAVLLMVVSVRRGARVEIFSARRWFGGAALAVYMIGFSFAYVSLDAGLGALILFGTVQVSLFLHAAVYAERPSRFQIIGAAVAFAGLALALWPEEGRLGAGSGAVFMFAAGLGWAAYTLAGRGAKDPVAVTAAHFVLCVPFLFVLLIQPGLEMTLMGWALAILSGAVTSGLGYTLWYSVLPGLPGARAAVVQLSVPIIAIVLGALLLQEAIGLKVVFAAVLVVGGIGFALISPKAQAGRR